MPACAVKYIIFKRRSCPGIISLLATDINGFNGLVTIPATSLANWNLFPRLACCAASAAVSSALVAPSSADPRIADSGMSIFGMAPDGVCSIVIGEVFVSVFASLIKACSSGVIVAPSAVAEAARSAASVAAGPIMALCVTIDIAKYGRR